MHTHDNQFTRTTGGFKPKQKPMGVRIGRPAKKSVTITTPTRERNTSWRGLKGG